ncbi:MAG: LamG domain-containing protein [Thermoproteota archaeon]
MTTFLLAQSIQSSLSTIAVYGQTITTTDTAIDYSTYRNSRLGINSIQYPSEWNVENRAFGDNTVRFINVEPVDFFNHAFDIYVYTPGYLSYYMSPDTPLSDVAAGIIDDTISNLSEIQLLNQTSGPTIDGNPSISIKYSYYDPVYGDTSAIRTITSAQNNVYDFLFQARPDALGEYLPVIEEMLASFRASAITTTTPQNRPPQTSCINPPPGLISWWPGDGNAEDIWGNNDGALQNGASFGPGRVNGGQAFRLDGIDDYVEIPSMNIGDAFTVVFWVSPERSASYQHLISNDYVSNSNFGAIYLNYENVEYWQDGQSRFVQDVVSGSQNNTATTIQPNTWSHIALTFNGTGIQLYINGAEQSGLATSGSVPHPETFNNALRIGSSIPHESSYFQGLIDDVEIYNRPLSQPEIRAISEGGKCQ